jgi:hypothetical protein
MSAGLRVEPPAGYAEGSLRPASTLIMLRETGAAPHAGAAPIEAFLQCRHEKMEFMPSVLVFPGGRMENADMAPRLLARTRGVDARMPEAAGLIVAAIRETFEECGVLYARPAGGAALIEGARMPALAEKRASLNRSEVGFVDLIEAEGLELAGDLIKPFARWITPWWHKKRFDTHFFVARAPEGQEPLHDGGEAVESLWLAPRREGLAAAIGKDRLLPPTQRCLQRIAELGTLDKILALPQEDAFRPVRPWLERRAEGFVLIHELVPGEARRETVIPRLSALGIAQDLIDAIDADLAARG